MKMVAIIGLGSIGKRHVTNLLAIGQQVMVGVDPGPHGEDRIPVVRTIEDLDYFPVTHAIVCTPPQSHLDITRSLLRKGTKVFVEKPLAPSHQEATGLLFHGDLTNCAVAVGYMERANPTVLAAKHFVTQNQVKNAYIELFWKMTRKTYEQDFLLESSHIIDTARFILGDMRVISSHVDGLYAEIKLAHNGGYTHLTINADALPMRRINLYAYNGERFGKQYGLETDEWDKCYQVELEAFLDGTPLCTGEDGVAVMEILEQVKR